MGLTYHPKTRVRERILIYGGPGTGKSTANLTIVKHTPDVHHHIIDNEIDNYERLLAEDEQFSDIDPSTFTIYPVDSGDWDEQLAAATEACSAAELGDWVMFDAITDTWGAVQRWFTDSVFKQDMSDYMLAVRQEVQQHNEAAKNDKQLKERKTLSAFEGFLDWSVINPQYQKLYRAFMGTKAHTCWVAEEDKLRKDDEDRQTRDTFGGIGFKPKGQKKLGYIPHTVIRTTKNQRDEWMMESVKDRGRELIDVGFTDFAKSYLVKVAGWKPVKV